jgi:peroxiredoxin
MAQLRRDSAEYRARGVRLLGVVVQKRRRLEAYVAKNPLPFPLLADESREVTRSYGVYVAWNFESWRIARPATFVIDGAGIIRYIYVGRHQFDRPKARLIWRKVEDLGAATRRESVVEP